MKLKKAEENNLSVVLATKNEEANISDCLKAVKQIADEIIVVDEYSADKTIEIARKYGAKVYKYRHKVNFHETKMKAIEKASCKWILQLDADERVTEQLSKEIKLITRMTNEKILNYQLIQKSKNPSLWRLFKRHQDLVVKKNPSIFKDSDQICAFFIPRVNYFLGKSLRYAGVYPDGVIRLFLNGKAKLEAKSVHELIKVEGGVGWLFNNLKHFDSPNFSRYIERMNRYTDFKAKELAESKLGLNFFQLINFSFFKPLRVFLNLYFRHKGFLDGIPGFVWSLFSSLHYPLSYFKYWQMVKKN